MDHQLVFENDPFNHIDIFSFSEFDNYNAPHSAQPYNQNIEEVYKTQPGHIAFLNPNVIKSQPQFIQQMMSMGNVPQESLLQQPNLENFSVPKLPAKIEMPTPKKETAKKVKKEPKNEPKKRGRKCLNASETNKRKNAELQNALDDDSQLKLPEKYAYLEDKERLGTLSEEEEKLLKKERRLIKNRESAQQFRKRQKQQTQELTDRVQELSDENNTLKHQVEALQHDKEEMQKQMQHLWSFVHKAFTFAVPYRVEQIQHHPIPHPQMHLQMPQMPKMPQMPQMHQMHQHK